MYTFRVIAGLMLAGLLPATANSQVQPFPRGWNGSETALEAELLRWARTNYPGRAFVAQQAQGQQAGRRQDSEVAAIATDAGFAPPLDTGVSCTPRCPSSLFQGLQTGDVLVILQPRHRASASQGNVSMELVTRTSMGTLWARNLSVVIHKRGQQWEIGDFYMTSH